MKGSNLFKHGLYGTRLHRIWYGMKERCYSPIHKSYKYYGGKGITVCEEWMDFLNFHKWAIENGLVKGMEVDRIDNRKGYSPENCRAVTRAENLRNTSRNRRVLLFGEEKCISEWFRDSRVAVGWDAFHARVKKGMSEADALTMPSRRKNTVRKGVTRKEGEDCV
jgi:hypothetical protein